MNLFLIMRYIYKWIFANYDIMKTLQIICKASINNFEARMSARPLSRV